MEPIAAAASADPAAGHVVGAKYELVRRLARGSMGEVWIARHATLGGEFAVKFLSQQPQAGDEGEDTATAMARFRFEAQVAARLSRKSRHIVAVTDHGEDFGRAYLVMELVEGESLETKMHRDKTLDLAFVSKVVSQIAKGLSQAHGEGVFHRDLKPANVLLAKDEDGEVVAKILDFGIAKAARKHMVAPPVSGEDARREVGHETEKGIVLGTPNYMSPEQARGLATLDHRCDVWALGVIAYEALTAHLPYDGETTADLLVNICTTRHTPVRDYRKDLPEGLEPFFAKAFAQKVADRFQEAAAIADALAKIAASVAPLKLGAKTERSHSIPPPKEVAAVPNAPTQKRIADDPFPSQPPPSTAAHATPFASEQDVVPKSSRTPLYVVAALLLAGLGAFLVVTFTRHDSPPASAASSPAPTNSPSTPPSPPAPSPIFVSPSVTAAETPPSATHTPVKPSPSPTMKLPSHPTLVPPPKPTPTPSVATPLPPPTSTTSKPIDKGQIL